MHRSSGLAQIYILGTTVFLLVGPRCLIFDLSEPSKPRLVSTEQVNKPRPVSWIRVESPFLFDRTGELDAGTINLPEIAGLPPRQRLELVLGRWEVLPWEFFSGDILTRADGYRLTTYHLDRLTEHSATFRRLGVYEPTPLLCGTVSQVAQMNGTLFESLL